MQLWNFNPRSPCGERLNVIEATGSRLDFNPRSPCGERQRRGQKAHKDKDFNPRSPCGERPFSRTSATGKITIFQSTLPMRGATISLVCWEDFLSISIHAPHAGSDTSSKSTICKLSNFNPRSPCGERRGKEAAAGPMADFNPRSPCGERQANRRHHRRR